MVRTNTILAEISKFENKHGIGLRSIYRRIDDYGWTVQEAVETRPKKLPPRLQKGKSLTLKKKCRMKKYNPHGIPYPTMVYRLRELGMTEQDAFSQPNRINESRKEVWAFFDQHENPHNITKAAFKHRLKKGMSWEDAMTTPRMKPGGHGAYTFKDYWKENCTNGLGYKAAFHRIRYKKMSWYDAVTVGTMKIQKGKKNGLSMSEEEPKDDDNKRTV